MANDMGLFAPSEKPVFSLHSVDVMQLDTDAKSMGLVIHVICWEHELQSPQVKDRADTSLKRTLNYLVNEGFISSLKGWNIEVAVMGHPPQGF
jgi:hypothetical protein